MAKGEYFLNKLPKLAYDTLYYDPEKFEQKYKTDLIKIVNQDMNLLSELVMPMHSLKHECNPWDSWVENYYYYYVNQDKKARAVDILGEYYGACDESNKYLDVYEADGHLYIDLKGEPSKNDIFECQRAMYFYNNYDIQTKLGMNIPKEYTPFAAPGAMFIYVDDFVKWDNKKKVYKMRYPKQNLKSKINECCENIANKQIKQADDNVQYWLNQEEYAYNVLRKVEEIKRARMILAQQSQKK